MIDTLSSTEKALSLEGLITTLLGKRIKIRKLLESESNQDSEDAKQNRVDLLAEDEQGVLYLMEIQNETEFAYFQRMLFGASKLGPRTFFRRTL